MLVRHAGLVIGRACALWAQGRVSKLLSLLVDDVVFAVPSRPEAASFLGEGVGRMLFAERLEMLLDQIEVLAFDPGSLATDGLWHVNRVAYRYRHRASGLVIAGTMRQRFAFVGDRIAHYQLLHDTHRMRAFYDLAARDACAA
jgi:hypothetical protein